MSGDVSKREQLEKAEQRQRQEEKANLQKKRADASARVDANIDSSAAGAARHELAGASQKSKAADAAALAQRNAEDLAKRSAVGSRSDDDISDEAAGRARKEMAQASEKRRQDEARELARSNVNQSRRNLQAGPRTDDNIDDDPAGILRKEKAAESKQRRARYSKELAEHSADLKALRSNAGARTDCRLDTEAAAVARGELALASQLRKEADQMRIKMGNYDLRKRLSKIQSKTNDGDGVIGGGLYEAAENSLLERDTDVWRANYLKFEVATENKETGRQIRDAKVFLQQRREENARQTQAEGKAHARERQQRQKRLRKLANEVRKLNRSKVRGVHEENARLQLASGERNRELRDAARMRVLEANQLDSRLDAAEAAMQAREREEGTKARLHVAQAVVDTRAQILEDKRLAVSTVQSARPGALSARSACFSPGRGRDKREASKSLARQKQENEEGYLSEARANRAKAEGQRTLTRKALLALLKVRRKHAIHERANDTLVKEEKARILASNRQEVALIYKKRFASKDEVTRMWDEPKDSPRSEHTRSAASV